MAVNVVVDAVTFNDVETINVGGKTLELLGSSPSDVLPEGYTKRNVLITDSRTTDACQIQTEYHIKSNSSFICRAFMKANGNNQLSLFTDHSASGNGFGFANGTEYRTYRGGTYRHNYGTAFDSKVHTFELFDNDTFKVDGQTVASDVTAGSGTTDNPMYILGDMHNGTIFAYLMVYEDDTLVANYIPCARDSDDAIGVYDTIGQKFFSGSNLLAI